MKNAAKFLGVIAITAIVGLAIAACKNPTSEGDNPEPTPTSTPITSVNITVTEPVKDATPATTASGNGNFTIGEVMWLPDNNPFLANTAYTAMLTLTANSGFTFSGMNSATINGKSATVTNNTATAVTLLYTFPATLAKTIASITIKAQPTKLTYMHGDLLDLTGLVVTLIYEDASSEDVAVTNFESKNINTNLTQGVSLIYSTHNGQPITITYGNLTPLATNNLIVNPLPITNAQIIVTAPVKGTAPSTTANGTGNFTIGAVTWLPVDNPFLGNTVYTATVTLTANSGYTFTGLNATTINGQNAIVTNNSGDAVTLSYAFPETNKRTVTNIAIKTHPTTLDYTHGDSIELTGLSVTLTYDDTTTEDIDAVDFIEKNITASPSHGNYLIHVEHDNQPITITYGSLTPLTTSNLTVNKALGNFGTPIAVYTTYTPELTLDNLSAPSNYTWNMPLTPLNAGNDQSFDATYIDPSGNYEPATGTITVNVARAIGATVDAPTLISKTHNSITINLVTASTGQTVEYAENTINTAPTSDSVWQTNTIFDSLNAGTTYFIFARTVENDNYEKGTASNWLIVTTLQTVPVNKIEYYWVNEHDIITTTNSGTGNAIILPKGETLTITANGNGYLNQRWYINGAEDKLQAGNITYSFFSEGKDSKWYTVALIVEKGGKYYNTNFAVMVTE